MPSFSYFRWHGWLSERDAIHEKDSASNRPREKILGGTEKALQTISSLLGQSRLGFTTRSRSVPRSARALQTEPKLWLRARPEQGTNWLNGWVIAGLSDPECWPIR
jgi:hypothetical protein